jgi:hypothetical protein
MRPVLLIAYLYLTLAASAAAAAPSPPGEVRDRLTFSELAGEAADGGFVHNDYFMPVGERGDALHELAGTLTVPYGTLSGTLRGFPGFAIAFFTDGGRLVPVERDIVRHRDSTWDIIVSAGTVWSEPGDNGWSRASFPFVLTAKTWNESHNGLATFVFNDVEVSDLRVQVVQEAAAWARFDGWAILPLDYTPGTIADLAAERTAFAEREARRAPVRPWAELELSSGGEPDGGFDGTAGHVTTSGLVVDGVLYARPCQARYGDYPYCGEMRHGVYSVTKPMGAALSLFWLAHKYGDDVFALKIADYVEVTARHDGWDDVTFAHVLNMMTGVGDNAPWAVRGHNDFEADEDDRNFARFVEAQGMLAKLDVAFSAGNYLWGPGEVGRYNTIQTFVLSAAMDAYLKSREGPGANLWDRVREEVLEPIGVMDAPMMHTREADGSRGVPILGWGYYATLSELSQVARLFQAMGAHDGRQLLAADRLETVMSGDIAPAYPIAWHNAFGEYRYYLSFWYMPFRAGAGCHAFLPQMLGLGGNLVTFMPNGMIGIRLADASDRAADTYDAQNMARLGDNLRSFCR